MAAVQQGSKKLQMHVYYPENFVSNDFSNESSQGENYLVSNVDILVITFNESETLELNSRAALKELT